MARQTFRWPKLVGSIVFLVLLIPVVTECGGFGKCFQSFWVRWLNNNVDGPIDFFGRVVDQDGLPVEGVDIRVELAKFRFSLPGTPWRVIEFHLNTDSQGYFKIIGETGIGISLYDFKKKGYEYVISDQQSSFNYEQNTTGIFHPDPNHPVIYPMRKKGEETYLVENERTDCFEYDQKESGTQRGYDFIMRQNILEKDFAHPMAGYIPLTCDIKTKANYDKKTNRWEVQIWPGDSHGGIIVSPHNGYTAPAEGYLPSYTIDPDAFIKEFNLASYNKPWVPSMGAAYVYLKSRTPPIYTKFHIKRVYIEEHRLSVGAGGYVTNPYGDRILEPATDVPWEIRSKLHEEMRDLYIHGRRPIKPDLSKLIQEGRQ